MKAPRSRSNVIQATQIHSISQEFFLVYPMKLLWINHFEYTVHPAFVSGQLVSMKLYLLRLSHLPKVSVCCCMFKLLHIIVHLNIQIPSTRAFFLRPRHALGRRRYRHVRGLAQLHGLRKSWYKIQQLYQLYTCFSGCRRDSRLPSAKKWPQMGATWSLFATVPAWESESP